MFCNNRLTNSIKGRLLILDYRKLVRWRARQIVEMKTGLEEEIKTLEEEKKCALERRKQLKEDEVKALKDMIPQEFLQELNEGASTLLSK